MLDLDERPAVAAHQQSRRTTIIVGIAFLALGAAWGWRAWEWSLVDDAGYRFGLLSAQREHGWLGGIGTRIVDTYRADQEGGQFRPFLYPYSAIFYLVEVRLAHVLRLFMFLGAVAAPALWLLRERRASPWLVAWAVLLFLSIPGFYEGLSFISVMELPAMLFAGIGFVDRNDRRRVLWFLLAGSCKSPMLVLLLAHALVLAFRRRFLLAGVSAIVGLAMLGVAALFARGGYYTARYDLTMANVTATIDGLAHQAWLPAVAVLAGLLLVRVRDVRLSDQSVVFGLASLGYAALMLPWGIKNGYNLAPPVYLGACTAIALAGTASARSTAPMGQWRVVVGVVLACIPAARVAHGAVTGILNRDETIQQTVQWLADAPPGSRVATNGDESAVRLVQILRMRGFNAGETPEVFWIQPGGALACRADYLIELDDQGAAALTGTGSVILTMPLGRIYQSAPCANA